ncbi:MAG: hypothetical protein PSV16_02655 [Flavobacterium sp.]|nr:hypothetical protein [Flavobacterium sp.]
MKKAAFLLIVFSIISCQSDKQYNTVTVKDKFAIELPADMVKAENLNKESSLQYQNLANEFYVIVIDETKKSFEVLLKEKTIATPDLDGYVSVMKRNLERTVSYPKFSAIDNSKINGLKARQFSVTGVVDDFSVYYEFAYIEGKSNYYQIAIWTEKSAKEAAQDKMKRIINSFKEIKKRG